MQEAAQAWVTVYVIAKQMNLAQALKALADLAPKVGLPEGLDGWESLAQRMSQLGAGDASEEGDEQSEEEQIAGFVQAVVNAVREKSEDAPKYFEAVSKMAVDPKAPPSYQELGNVLKKFMSGIKNPDLSGLPKEIAEIVQKAINE